MSDRLDTGSSAGPRARGAFVRHLPTVMVIACVAMLAMGLVWLEDSERRQASAQIYRTMSVLGDLVSEIQATADADANAAGTGGIGAICAKYDGQTFCPSDLPGAQITVECFRNEATVPDALGGSQDLNLDGDILDDFSDDAGGFKMKVVPMELTLRYIDGTSKIHRVITPRPE